jgi:hypothetical protein
VLEGLLATGYEFTIFWTKVHPGFAKQTWWWWGYILLYILQNMNSQVLIEQNTRV